MGNSFILDHVPFIEYLFTYHPWEDTNTGLHSTYGRRTTTYSELERMVNIGKACLSNVHHSFQFTISRCPPSIGRVKTCIRIFPRMVGEQILDKGNVVKYKRVAH